MTSKCHSMADLYNLQKYGYRGEALASIIDVSSGVEIQSRAEATPEAYTKKFIQGVPSGSVRRTSWRRPSHGVTVSIEGFLSRLPVRQKQITALEIENIKKVLEKIYLMKYRLQLDFKHQGIPILQTPPADSVIEAFHFLYKKTIIESFSAFGVFFIQAWFSKELHASKSFQFVFVNNRFTARNKIHKTVDQMLTELLGAGRKAGPDEPKSKRDKYPIFVVNVITSKREYDITLEPMKSLIEFKDWEQVLTAVESLGLRFKVTLHAGLRSFLNEATPNKPPLAPSASAGKSISTLTLSSAIHSRFARRVVQNSPPPFSDESQSHPGPG